MRKHAVSFTASLFVILGFCSFLTHWLGEAAYIVRTWSHLAKSSYLILLLLSWQQVGHEVKHSSVTYPVSVKNWMVLKSLIGLYHHNWKNLSVGFKERDTLIIKSLVIVPSDLVRRIKTPELSQHVTEKIKGHTHESLTDEISSWPTAELNFIACSAPPLTTLSLSISLGWSLQ